MHISMMQFLDFCFGIVWCWQSIFCFQSLVSLPHMSILAGLIVLVLAVEWLSTKIRIKLARG